MNKFFFFTLKYYCLSYSEDQQGFELISSSTLISIYLVIWDLFYSNIRDYLPISVLFIIQLIPSGYYSISFSIKVLVILISTGNALVAIFGFCFIVYLFYCFGGLFNCFSCDKEDQDFVGCYINKNDDSCNCICCCCECKCCDNCKFDEKDKKKEENEGNNEKVGKEDINAKEDKEEKEKLKEKKEEKEEKEEKIN